MKSFRFKIDLEHISKHTRYGIGKLYLSHLEKFMDDAGLFPLDGKAAIAVSAGMDSMCLMLGLYLLKKKGRLRELKVLHVNHGTRKENDLEEKLVRESAEVLGLEIIVKQLKLSESSNFEKQARDSRYQFFREATTDKEVVFTAHHIDDSFEWSMLQGLKSSHLTPTLGIPVIRGRYHRPFMCLTREHIRKIVKKLKIPYMHDISNDNNDFERNFLRNEIIPGLREKHPSYLKHYVYRANDMARILKKSVLFEDHSEDIHRFRDQAGAPGLFNWELKNEFFIMESEMASIVREISQADRGTLRSQIAKMCRAQSVGKQGPLIFSGGVEGHMSNSSLYFINKEMKKALAQIDEELAHEIKKMTHGQQVLKLSEFEQNLKFKVEGKYQGLLGHYFPFWVASYDQVGMRKIMPGLKAVHPLWPKLTAEFIAQDMWFHTGASLLKSWRKMHRAPSYEARLIF